MIKGSWADVIENKYNTEQRCEKLFLSHLWPDGIKCPKCGKYNPITNKIHTNKQKTFVEFKCSYCGKKIHEKTNCIFTRSQLSFRDWLKAVYRIAIKQKSTSSIQMEDELGIYQQAAWHLFIRISQLAQQDMEPFDKLKGEVEMDEWYENGDPRYKHNYQHSIYGSDKGIIGESIPIFGMIERPTKYIDEYGNEAIFKQSKIVLQMLNLRGQRSVSSDDISNLVEKYIEDSATVTLYTDAAKIYESDKVLKQRFHAIIPHNVTKDTQLRHDEKYVQDNIYTNNIEGTFGQISDYFTGTHNKVTRKHVQKYLDMFCFRWNNRDLITEEKIHKYLSKLPKFPHVNIKELIGDDSTGTIRKELRFFIKFHSDLVSELNEVPIDKVEYRTNFIKMIKSITVDLFGPNAEKRPETPYMREAMKKCLSDFIDIAKYLDKPDQEQFYKNIEKELSQIPFFEDYSELIKNLEFRADVGDITYDDKNVDGEDKRFRQRQYSRKYAKNQKLKKQENAKNSDKNTSKKTKKNPKKSLSSNRK